MKLPKRGSKGWDATLKGWAELQSDMINLYNKIAGSFSQRLIAEVAGHTLQEAIRVTHKDTHGLARSHRMRMNPDDLRAIIFISRQTRSPNGLPYQYGEVEHARGGDHAFYDIATRLGADFAESKAKQFERRIR